MTRVMLTAVEKVAFLLALAVAWQSPASVQALSLAKTSVRGLEDSASGQCEPRSGAWGTGASACHGDNCRGLVEPGRQGGPRSLAARQGYQDVASINSGGALVPEAHCASGNEAFGAMLAGAAVGCAYGDRFEFTPATADSDGVPVAYDASGRTVAAEGVVDEAARSTGRTASTALGKSIESLKQTLSQGEEPWKRITAHAEGATSPGETTAGRNEHGGSLRSSKDRRARDPPHHLQRRRDPS